MWFWKRKSRQEEVSSPTFKIAIEPDDYHARHVGRTPDGKQFFLTTPFAPALSGEPGCEYIALYIFSSKGVFEEARIDSLGPRTTMDRAAREGILQKRLSEMDGAPARIEIVPFSHLYDGREFGLIYRAAEDEDDLPAVEAQPGNYMAFFEPWKSGEYDT